MHRRIATLAAVLVLAAVASASAQKSDPDAQKVATAYEAAFNKGDAKAIAALYTPDALRVAADGVLIAGRTDIEQAYVTAFAGAFKGAKLSLTVGRTVNVTPDVKLIEGTFAIAGAASMKGRYLNTMARQGGQWLLASVSARADAPPVK